MGLAICAKLVKGMRGKIWVESEEGKGSSFHFSVPLAVAPVWLGDSPHEQFTRLKGLRLLVVSHIPICRSILSEFLQDWDVQSTSIASGQAALDVAKRAYRQGKPFGVILVDGSMPEMVDLALAKQFMGDPETRDARIVLLTALDSLSQSTEALKLGLLHRVANPPRLLDLLTTIVKALDAPVITSAPSLPADGEHGLPCDDIKLNILVAEDNPINRILAIRMLERMGQNVTAVEDGEAVLQALAEHDFDLILMDVEMPHKNGLETAKAIRESELHTGKHITIIATTAHVREEDQQRILDAGMDGCVTKPIDWKQLMESVKSSR